MDIMILPELTEITPIRNRFVTFFLYQNPHRKVLYMLQIYFKST